MNKYLILLAALFISIFQVKSQNYTHLELETQWYPAGYEFMVSGEYGVTANDAFHLKLGYNLARRKNFSPYNDFENGGGIGATLGYRRYFTGNSNSGLYIGVRTDIWSLSIDWEDADATPNAGTTKIVVLQPTGEIGYLYQFPESPIAIGLNAAAGWEVNIVTKGEEVGEGRMGLLGFRLRYSL